MALVILQLGLVGVVGIFTLASTRLTDALLLERGAAVVAEVADSLSGAFPRTSGESVRGEWRVSWQSDGSALVVRAVLQGRREEGPLVQVEVP